MKEFINWLGVNEKIAKLVVWILIIFIMLIIVNAALDSLGFPHYQITYDNLKKIGTTKLLNDLTGCLTCLLNFFAIVLLVFRIKEFKKILKYAVIYTIISWIITLTLGKAILQVFIFLYILIFCYLYSGKNKKYILYGFLSLFINTIFQSISYLYKVKFIDYTIINSPTKAILFCDYFIIMGIIILVKEIYLKKRSEKVWDKEDQEVGFGLVNSKKKETSQKN